MKNLSIKTQMYIGLSSILLLVALLGAVSWYVGESLWQETKGLYEHPLAVRKAIDSLTTNVLSMQQDMNDLVLTENEQERQSLIQSIDTLEVNSSRQFDILYDRYLGSKNDIDEVNNLFIQWKSIRSETIRLFNSGSKKEAIDRTKGIGVDGSHQKKIIRKTRDISDFAEKRANKFFTDASAKKKNLVISLTILISIILLLSWSVSRLLLNSVKEPLQQLTLAARDFKKGNMDIRSSYNSANEFGLLSTTFNELADTIQTEIHRKEATAQIAEIMLKENDLASFCKTMLNEILAKTGSQIAAIYLLNETGTEFVHFDSIGLSQSNNISFSAFTREGEFGVALATKKIQRIKDIPADTYFNFSTVIGNIQPREILTIPILSNGENIAVLSLASIHSYSTPVLWLVNEIWNMLTARFNEIMAIRQIRFFSERLEQQNLELEAQKNELESQSSELTRQNSELEMQKQQLSEVSQLKTSFLSNMSHELRTPLNSVIALSGVMGRRLVKKIPDEEYSYLEVIERNGKHLLNLINDILDISRIEAGREEVEVTKFTVNSLVSDVVSMIRPQADQKNVEILFTGELDQFITSDMNKCRHILQNLIGNAVKFTEIGKVHITTRLENNKILIIVTDTGIGISEPYIPHIFEEFRQADSGTARKFGGTGLGLAIAKKYANLLGGNITVTSTIGKGSEFILHLPLQYFAKNKISDPPKNIGLKQTIYPVTPNPVNDSLTKTILLVEDSEPAIIQMKDFLEESGYQILVARGGTEALGIIANVIPDAMILDLMMPGVDGFSVLKAIRDAESTAHIPVLILTAKHITKEELKFLKRNNIHELIQKGDVNRKELQNAVAAMVYPKAEESNKPQRELQTIEGKPVVLVVEDNADNMITVKAILSDNFTVIEAVDGFAGVEKAKKDLPNLILMDIQLPGMSGIDAFKAIRKNVRLEHIPIIALTASAMLSDRETILAHGFNGYIAKPIDENLFLKTIGECLYGN
jgi:signal transduction histidine kinase/CheY-like chemotaxis protein/HAMP domain-containing protein